MSIYYTYLLKHIPTNTFYYGVRFAEGCRPDEFWKTYFTSSRKKIPVLREQYGDDSFEFEIRKTFTDRKKAVDWESKVLRRMGVLESPELWLNRTDNKAILYENHPKGMLGKKHKPETLEKRNLPKGINHHQYGKPFPENTLRLALEARKNVPPWNKGKKGVQKGKCGPDNHNFGKPAYNRGIPMSEDHKEKLRKPRKRIICPHCGKEGGAGSTMQRYHFDNCKLKGNIL